MTTYNVMKTEKYIGADKIERTSYFQVGVAFDLKDNKGLSVRIAPGVALSGDFIIMPRKAREDAGSTEAEDDIPL